MASKKSESPPRTSAFDETARTRNSPGPAGTFGMTNVPSGFTRTVRLRVEAVAAATPSEEPPGPTTRPVTVIVGGGGAPPKNQPDFVMPLPGSETTVAPSGCTVPVPMLTNIPRS